MDGVKRLYVNVWNSCNLSCRHCFNNGGSVAGRLLDTKEIINLLREARDELGVQEVQLSGGEPTLRPDLPELIDGLLSLNLSVLLQTNGTFGGDVARELMRFEGRRLKLIVSLDGTDTNDVLRGAGSTARTVGSIKLLSCFPIRVNILLSSLIAWREIEEIADLARNYRLLLAFNPICPSGRADESLLMNRDRYFDWMLRLEEMKRRGIVIRKCFECPDGTMREVENCPVRAGRALVVAADGDVYPCGFLTNIPELRMGNVRDMPLAGMLERTPQSCRELSEECRECGNIKAGLCNGGCPARIYYLNGGFTGREYYCVAARESGMEG